MRLFFGYDVNFLKKVLRIHIIIIFGKFLTGLSLGCPLEICIRVTQLLSMHYFIGQPIKHLLRLF